VLPLPVQVEAVQQVEVRVGRRLSVAQLLWLQPVVLRVPVEVAVDRLQAAAGVEQPLAVAAAGELLGQEVAVAAAVQPPVVGFAPVLRYPAWKSSTHCLLPVPIPMWL